MPTPINASTLRYAVNNCLHITAHCCERECRHSAALDLATLVERFGADFNLVERRAEFLAALRCSKCGSKNLTLISAPQHRH